MKTDQSAAPCTALEPLPSSVEALARDIERYQFYHLGRLLGSPPLYTYQALARTLRDRLMSDWMNTYVARDQPGNQLVLKCLKRRILKTLRHCQQENCV